MSSRKLWVKRPNATATLVKINENDLVDDVKDLIITKYANSLGRTFDAPEVTLWIISRERSQQVTERILGPDEYMVRTLETYFPGGQLMEEALLVDIPMPLRRTTPRPSPSHAKTQLSMYEDAQLVNQSIDYFPPMPSNFPCLSQSSGPYAAHDHRPTLHESTHPHSMAILQSGQLLPLPSPNLRDRKTRPRTLPRVISPTIDNGHDNNSFISTVSHTPRHRPGVSSIGDSKHSSAIPAPPPLSMPSAMIRSTEFIVTKSDTSPVDQTELPRLMSKRTKKQPVPNTAQDRSSIVFLAAGLLDGSVPPINVLIVEDNDVSLRLLEKFIMKLKVRWDTAKNGRDAVIKWRAGGFHLVLMDLQMPIMNGLEATREMRRLERVNGIGVFAKGGAKDRDSASNAEGKERVNGDATEVDTKAEDVNNDNKLTGPFKSPVIVVALTASSLQSDRHEALAAGCNDFLTKPVNDVWLQRKIMEWGCMQALIDFDGWRQWKSYGASTDGATDEPTKGKGEKKDLDPTRKKAKQEEDAKKAILLAKKAQCVS